MSRNKHGLARTIPLIVERQVREECGYGCALCGQIFVHLHHFDPEYADAKEHNPKKIICLCEDHHTRAGSGEISLETIRQARANPYGHTSGSVSQDIYSFSTFPSIVLGSNITSSFALSLDCLPLIWFRRTEIPAVGGRQVAFLMSAVFRDEAGQALLTIRDNVIQKLVNGIPIQKISSRYIVGDHAEPLLSFRIIGSSEVQIDFIRSTGVDTTLKISAGTMQLGDDRFEKNLVLSAGAAIRMGRTPLFLQSEENDRVVSCVRDALGKEVGAVTSTHVLALDGTVRARIRDGVVSRLFLRRDGRTFEEHPIGSYEDQMIWSLPLDLRQGMPPYYFDAEFAQSVTVWGNGGWHHPLCISRYICSPKMPAEALSSDKCFLQPS